MKLFTEPQTWIRHDLLPEILLSKPIGEIANRMRIKPAQFMDENELVSAFAVQLPSGIFFAVVQRNKQDVVASVYVPQEYCKNDLVKKEILTSLGQSI